MTPDQSEPFFLDMRDRLTRIEVKVDNTNEKIKDHDRRLSTLEDEVAAQRVTMATYVKVGGLLTSAAAALPWIVQHTSIFSK